MSEILCSTGALLGNSNGRDYRLLEKLAKELKCDGFEFMMYSSWYDEVEELKSVLSEMKLYIPVMHCVKHIGERISEGGKEKFQYAYKSFETNCQIAKVIDAKKLVLHLWSGPASDCSFDNNIMAYKELVNISSSYGIELLIENIVCNRESPMKRWCDLYEKYPDIKFVYDTKMAAFHEEVDLLYEKEYEWLWNDDHITHYHVNDYGGGYKDWQNLRTLPIGQGHIDFEKFFEYIDKIGYNGTYTIESTAFRRDGSIDVDMLNKQFEYIRSKVR